MGTAREDTQKQNDRPVLHLALLIQRSIYIIEDGGKGGAMDDMMDVFDVLDEFFKEYFGFRKLWQPNTS